MFKWFHDFYSDFNTDISFYALKALQSFLDPLTYFFFQFQFLMWTFFQSRSDVDMEWGVFGLLLALFSTLILHKSIW